MTTEEVTIIKELLAEVRYPVSRREYFAARAMQGILREYNGFFYNIERHDEAINIAICAYTIADAMLGEE